MCGIAFVSRVTPVTRRILPYLAFAMQDRGDDSWGCSDGNNVLRRVGPVCDSWEIPAWAEDDRPFMLHTRGASVGEVVEANAHPFEFEGVAGRFIGIHNGGVRNHTELNKRYDRGFAVDSMHVFRHMADGLPTDEVAMVGVCVWVRNNDGVIRLARHVSSDIYVTQLRTGELVGASTEYSLVKAVNIAGAGPPSDCYKIEAEYEYAIYPDADVPEFDELYRGERCPFAYQTVVTATSHGGRTMVGSFGGNSSSSAARSYGFGWMGADDDVGSDAEADLQARITAVTTTGTRRGRTFNGAEPATYEYCAFCGRKLVRVEDLVMCGACHGAAVLSIMRERRRALPPAEGAPAPVASLRLENGVYVMERRDVPVQ